MALNRRNFLLFMGASAGTVALGSFPKLKKNFSMPFTEPASAASPSANEQTLFLSIQHPGEVNGIRKVGVSGYEDRMISMRTPGGQKFMQTRRVPIGSNWPSKKANDPPQSAVVAIRRSNGKPLTTT